MALSKYFKKVKTTERKNFFKLRGKKERGEGKNWANTFRMKMRFITIKPVPLWNSCPIHVVRTRNQERN